MGNLCYDAQNDALSHGVTKLYSYWKLCLVKSRGGGYSHFFFILRLGPSIYRSPQKYQEFQAPQKIFEILTTPKNLSHSVP